VAVQGEEVAPFQLVCQVQSDKATVDITSRFKGRVVRTHFVPGDVIKVRGHGDTWQG